METDKSTQLEHALKSDAFKKRTERALRFEQISGGGTAKQLERLVRAPAIYIPYLIFAKAGLSRVINSPIRLFWGRTVRLPLNDYDALILYMYGALHGIESKLMYFFIRNLKPDDVLYDIGANRGFFTYLGAELCGEVHTFEAMQELAGGIASNVQPGERVVVNAAAVTAADGTIDFYLMDSTMLNTTIAEVASQGNSRKVTVPAVTLDTYVQTHTPPTYLKIDAEGGEEYIITGAKQFLVSHSPVIAMEVWGKDNRGEVSMRAVEALRALGYRSYAILTDGSLQDAQGDLSAQVAPDGADNFVFKK